MILAKHEETVRGILYGILCLKLSTYLDVLYIYITITDYEMG